MNITKEGNNMNETYQDAEELSAVEEALQAERIRHFELVSDLIKLAYDTPNDSILGEKVRKHLQNLDL